MNNTYDFIVLGGGIAGLSFAYEVSEKGFSVLVIEQEAIAGGLSKTISYKGFRFDYCAHRFHSANQIVMDRIKNLMKGRFYSHRQISRILMFGAYLKYPFQLQNLLRAMPIRDAILCSFSFLNSRLKKGGTNSLKTFLNYKDWFVNHFGSRLYTVMCEPYTTKIWKVDPSLLSADWADQRFQGVNIRKLIAKTISKLVRFNFSSYSLEDENLVPDGGEFWYPLTGIQEISDRFCEEIEKNKGIVLTSSIVKKVDIANKKIYYQSKNQINFATYSKAVISTIPLHDLYESIRNEIPNTFDKDINNLKYMNIIFVYLLIDKERVSPDHWLYFPDPAIVFNRSVEFKNWSTQMAPEGKTAICLDITCYKNDEIWDTSREDLVERCISDCIKVGLLAREDVFDSLVLKIKDAYPFYDLNYAQKVKTLVNTCEKSGEVFCLGRTGIFQYNNADGSIEMAMELANRLCASNWQTGDASVSLLNYKFAKTSF